MKGVEDPKTIQRWKLKELPWRKLWLHGLILYCWSRIWEHVDTSFLTFLFQAWQFFPQLRVLTGVVFGRCRTMPVNINSFKETTLSHKHIKILTGQMQTTTNIYSEQTWCSKKPSSKLNVALAFKAFTMCKARELKYALSWYLQNPKAEIDSLQEPILQQMLKEIIQNFIKKNE